MDCDGNELLLSDILGTDEDMIMRPLEDDVDISVLRQALRDAARPGAGDRADALRSGRRGGS